jgi:DNA invertase Pin-like site-specific DNA recombinase
MKKPLPSRAPAFISYLRVSTDQLGLSGLGLEAQREAVAKHVARAGGRLVSEYVEIETGKKAARPELAKALAACRAHRTALVVAKLDRLARRGNLEGHRSASAPGIHPCRNAPTTSPMPAMRQHKTLKL